MSYVDIKPEYYRMHQPDSPWHAGSEGWKSSPIPSWGVNPNLVGPPRLAVEGLGAYYAPEYEKAVSPPIAGLGEYFSSGVSGLGSTCPCAARGVGDAASDTIDTSSNKLSGMMLIGLGALVIVGGIVFLGPQRKHS